MKLTYLAVLGLAGLSWVTVDCVTGAKPVPQTCPTTAQTTSLQATGSCGPPGLITLSTTPGLCAIQVGNGPAVGLPSQGNFDGDAAGTHYQLAGGNWSLNGGSSDPQADPSTRDCEVAQAAGDGSLTVNCNLNECVPSGEDNGFACTQSACVMHLTMPPPDGGFVSSDASSPAAPDAGAMDGSNASEAGTTADAASGD